MPGVDIVVDEKLAQLDAMIEEGEERLAAFERRLAFDETGMDMPRAMHVLGILCRKLNTLYAERHALVKDLPSRTLH